ncbi:zinc finger protein 862-like [Gigantopelta aegis]|uniref:zinc finger protein 862-like n=2 Tax=Gigantopelta aegis TaxID=1735272 RepID=UPI001B88DC1D|nr:zinc finger protein 862-like [Gigantopelta aegis]
MPVIYRHLKKMDKETFTRMCHLFDWAYTVAHSELCFTNFPVLISVEKKHGVNLGNTYANDKACRTFVDEIGETMADDLKHLFSTEPFYCSILFDGSTDKSLSEKEVISVKLLEDGLPRFKLLGITEPGQCTAEGIYNAITAKTREMQLDIKTCCVATAADGASVNFGKESGVLVRLKKTMPWLIMIHCIAHRLELALKDSFKGSFYELEIDNLMMHLYYMYRRSVKKWHELQRTAETFGEHVVKPSRSQGTRWIDHRRKALTALIQDYRCIVTQLQEQGSELRKDIPAGDRAKMRGYSKLMTSHRFVLYLASYQDLVEDLAELSLSLQDDNLPISGVRANIDLAQANLISMVNNPGRNLRRVLLETTAAENDGVVRFKGIELVTSPSEVDTFNRKSKEIIERITICISSRFRNFVDDPVLSAADILDPTNYPTDHQALAVYGQKEITTLTDHFNALLVKKGCQVDEIEREWAKLKYDISRNHRQEAFYPLWQKMLTQKEDRYSNVLHLVRILLVCPIATAHVERQFSYIKRILGDWRLNLGLSTIQHLLRICSEGPEPENFQPAPAVNRWRSSCVKSRRPEIMPYGPRKKAKSIAATPTDYEQVDSDTDTD